MVGATRDIVGRRRMLPVAPNGTHRATERPGWTDRSPCYLLRAAHPAPMALDRRLLSACLDLAPSQPATALWRAVEVGHLVRQDVLPRSGTGLDLGCGDGRVTRLVRDELGARWTLTGLDPDELELELATSCGIYDVLLRADGATSTRRTSPSTRLLEQRARARRRAGAPPRRGRPRSPAWRSFRVHGSLGSLPREPRKAGRARAARDGGVRSERLPSRPRRAPRTRALPVRGGVESAPGVDRARCRPREHVPRPRGDARWATVSNATAGILVRLRGGRPIDVQRSLGLRRARPPLLVRAVGSTIGRAGAIRLQADEATTGSCLLIGAVKQSTRDVT